MPRREPCVCVHVELAGVMIRKAFVKLATGALAECLAKHVHVQGAADIGAFANSPIFFVWSFLFLYTGVCIIATLYITKLLAS